MDFISLEELKKLLSQESDIMIEEINSEYVYLAYPPLDISTDDIFIVDSKYLIEIQTLLEYLSDEIFLNPVEVLYDEDKKPIYFIVKE